MHVGAGNLCLRVTDLEKSIRFYAALGLSQVDGQGVTDLSALVRRGNFSIFLMTFGEDSLNFRGADAFDIYEHLRGKRLELKGKPERYTSEERGEDGTAWMTYDPDGHGVFFNTHRRETTPEHRQERVCQLLQNTEQDLVDLGASAECLDAFREVLAKFGSD
jgi:catechol 2,3-dioxygenase-like lactoylglutathione lyase family enzyme